MIINKPSAIAERPFSTIKVNTSKEKSFYTQGQQFVARVLCIVWLLPNLAPKFLFRVQIGLTYPASPCGPLSGPTDLLRPPLWGCVKSHFPY